MFLLQSITKFIKLEFNQLTTNIFLIFNIIIGSTKVKLVTQNKQAHSIKYINY